MFSFSTFLLSKHKTQMIILVAFLDLIESIIFGKTMIFNKVENKLFLDEVGEHNKFFIRTKSSQRVNIILVIRETRRFEATVSPLIIFMIKFVAKE